MLSEDDLRAFRAQLLNGQKDVSRFTRNRENAVFTFFEFFGTFRFRFSFQVITNGEFGAVRTVVINENFSFLFRQGCK